MEKIDWTKIQKQRLKELNAELETLNSEARELEERIADNIQSLLQLDLKWSFILNLGAWTCAKFALIQAYEKLNYKEIPYGSI